jgi:hypothetical protein
LVADLDYTEAPSPDPDDICDFSAGPREWVALMSEDIEKEKPLPPFPTFEEETVRKILRKAESEGYFKAWQSSKYYSVLQHAKTDTEVAALVSQGPVRGQFRREIQAYLFALALPLTEWVWHRAMTVSLCVLYPEAMLLVTEKVLGVDKEMAYRIYRTNNYD